MHEIAEYGIAAHALYKDSVGSPTEMLSREFDRLCLAAPHHRAAGRRLESGRIPRAHQARAVPRPGVLLHAEGQADRAAAQGDRRSISPMRCTPTSATPRSAARSTARSRRCCPSSTTATRSRSSPRRRRRRRRRPGNRSWSPARRARRSAAPRASRCARNMPGSAGASSSGCSSAPRSEYSDEKLTGALPRLARASIDDVLAAVGPRRDAGLRRRARHVSRLQGRARGRDGAPPKSESGWFGLKQAEVGEVQGAGRQRDGRRAIPIRGINGDLPVRFAPNGGAVPGDRIVGILTPGEGITIYPIQSPALKDFEDTPERWLDVRWDVDEQAPQRFPARSRCSRSTSPARSRRSPR